MRKDILTFLLFVVLAALIWYGHAMQSVRNTHVPVLIQYTGKPGPIGLGEPGLPDTVMIEVRDAGARLNYYHRDPLRLTIDLHAYIHGDKGTIHVPSDALRRSISDILQGTSRLIDTKPEEILCPYFTEQEKSVAVACNGQVSPATEYQIVSGPTLSNNRIKLYGEDKKLTKIDTVYTEPFTLQEIMDTTDIRVALMLPKGTRSGIDSVNVRVICERFTEKKFIVPLHVKNLPEGSHIRLFPKEVEVNVRVGMNHFTEVQPQDIYAFCTYKTDRIDKLDVDISYTNPYITAAWAYPGVVEFILEQ